MARGTTLGAAGPGTEQHTVPAGQELNFSNPKEAERNG